MGHFARYKKISIKKLIESALCFAFPKVSSQRAYWFQASCSHWLTEQKSGKHICKTSQPFSPSETFYYWLLFVKLFVNYDIKLKFWLINAKWATINTTFQFSSNLHHQLSCTWLQHWLGPDVNRHWPLLEVFLHSRQGFNTLHPLLDLGEVIKHRGKN